MSKLYELIAELCPNGVEYKTIEEVCEISRGIVISKDFIRDNAGEYPVYSSQTENEGCLGFINTFKYDGEYLTWTTDGANAGTVFYRNGRFSITNVCGLLKVIEKNLSSKFLYYALSISAPNYVNRGMGNAKLMSNVMASIKIPIPPLPVQEEIVRILDKFTSLTAELTAELTARRKQYEYYRDALLTKETKVEVKKLSEIFDTRNGYTPSTSNSDFWDNGTIPWFVMEDIRGNGRILSESKQHITESAVKKSGLFPANSIIVATSATIGEHALITRDFLCNQRFTCLSPKAEYKNKIDMKYMFYYAFKLDEFCKKNTTKSSFASVDMSKFYDFKFPLPPLSVQQRIVDVLDNFDAICSDLNIGLPAEIDARKKQYEYYRDLLLTFAERGNTIFTEQNRTEQMK